MAATSAIWKKLDLFWRKSNCSKKFKLIAYDAEVRAKLLYGLEAAQINKAEKDDMDSFFYKRMRKILGWKTTFGLKEQGKDMSEGSKTKIKEEINRIINGGRKKG